MKVIDVVLLLFFATVLAQKPFTWKNCGKDLPYIVNDLTITPYPVIQGKSVSVISNGTQNEEVNGGTWVADLYYYNVKVKEYTGDVCGLAPKCPCPCKPGNVVSVFKRIAPFIAPNGEYTGMFIS